MRQNTPLPETRQVAGAMEHAADQTSPGPSIFLMLWAEHMPDFPLSKNPNVRACITGITGFLGTHLAEHLLASGDQVLGLARKTAWPPHLPSTLSAIPLASWDLADPVTGGSVPEKTIKVLRDFQPEVIYHFAALSNPRDCGQVTPNALAMQINVAGTRQIAELAAGLSSPPRIIFASTGHVYGWPAAGTRVHEESLLEPSRGYGMTKLAAEGVLRDVAARRHLEIVIARSFQHAGPRQEPRLMLAEWASQLAAEKPGPLRVHNLTTRIDLTDGRDAAAAYRALAADGKPGGVYNIGAGTAQQTGEILNLLLEVAGTHREILEAEPGFRRNLIAEIGRIQTETGWAPRVPITATVRDTYNWWQQRVAVAKANRSNASAGKESAPVS